jgi:hypothetical protein
MVVKIVSRAFKGCLEIGKYTINHVATMTYLAVPGEMKKPVGQVWANIA